MAGHSKFKNIMHRKGAQDKRKAKVFTKILRDIVTAARSGGGNPNDNPSLRTTLEKARVANMTKDVIERAIKRGTGELAGVDYIERTYEGYAAGGVAVMVQTLTDNPTRTITNVRTAFNKYGGNVGSDGAVAWMFDRVGYFYYPASVGNEDKVMDAALNAGASDVETDEEGHTIYSDPADFAAVEKALTAALGVPEEAEITYRPTQWQPVTDEDTLASIEKTVAALEDDDDVQRVTVNLQ